LLLHNNICINFAPQTQDSSGHSQGSEPVIYLYLPFDKKLLGRFQLKTSASG